MNIESRREGWQNPVVFDVYKTGRDRLHGLFEEQVLETIEPYLLPDTTILEVGAGSGVLRSIAAHSTPKSCRWIETDQTHSFLTLKRRSDSTQAAVEAPFFPLKSQSINTVVGLASFDTFTETTLAATFDEVAHVLKPSGKVLHILDLAPNTDNLTRDAHQRGLLAIPGTVSTDNHESRSAMFLVDITSLEQSLPKMDIPGAVKRTIRSFIDNYEGTFIHFAKNQPEVFDYIAQLLLQANLVQETVSLWDNFTNAMLRAAANAGLVAVRNEIVTAEKCIRYSAVKDKIAKGTNYVTRSEGVSNSLRLSGSGAPAPGTVQIRSNVLVHEFMAA